MQETGRFDRLNVVAGVLMFDQSGHLSCLVLEIRILQFITFPDH